MEAVQTTLLYGKQNSAFLGEFFMPWLQIMMCKCSEWEQLDKHGEIDLDGNDPNADFGCKFEREEKLKEEFYHNPGRQHLTEIEAWKILASMKTVPCVSTIHHYIWKLSRDCTLFVLESGYIGTGPKTIQTGDLKALIPGVSMPMVLRLASTVGQYTVIGPAYVHGTMDKEIWDHWKNKTIEVRLV